LRRVTRKGAEERLGGGSRESLLLLRRCYRREFQDWTASGSLGRYSSRMLFRIPNQRIPSTRVPAFVDGRAAVPSLSSAALHREILSIFAPASDLCGDASIRVKRFSRLVAVRGLVLYSRRSFLENLVPSISRKHAKRREQSSAKRPREQNKSASSGRVVKIVYFSDVGRLHLAGTRAFARFYLDWRFLLAIKPRRVPHHHSISPVQSLPVRSQLLGTNDEK